MFQGYILSMSRKRRKDI